ncbi:MAG: hypothetical protein EOP11_05950 [Proteobacteria bacterium]|nr:MAG: hypothetical protein EOP11_05950 [Pseudomonadota bacterium]
MENSISMLVFFAYSYLLLFVGSISWMITPAVFANLAASSPHRRRVKWWIFMPLASFAACLVGTFWASLAFAVPTILLWNGPSFRNGNPGVFYCTLAGALSALIAARKLKRWDAELHRA